MTNRRRRKRKQETSFIGDIFHFILALALIAAAIFIVVFVIGKVKNIAGSIGQKPSEETKAETELVIDQIEEAKPGWYEAEDGKVYWLLEDAKTYAKDTFLKIDGSLYYFNHAGQRQTGTKGIDGMLFQFGEDGKIDKISYNPSFRPEAGTAMADYPSLVKSRSLWSFLEPEDSLGTFSALMYKRTTDPMAHQLGGDENPQYTMPYSMQIDGNYIYYLPLAESASLTEEEQKLNGTLYRMKPGESVRQIVARDVEGYKVFEGTVYYCSNGNMYETDTAEDDPTKTIGTNRGDPDSWSVRLIDGTPYLTYPSGDVVETGETEIKSGNFTYLLGDGGQILGTKEKTSVNTGGYTYYAEGDTVFGSYVSRMVRKDGSGKEEIISAEFHGKVGNLHYDFDTGMMIAEFEDGSGVSRILKISKNGDVDYVSDNGAGVGSLKLLAIEDGKALCREQAEGIDRYLYLDLSDSVPLAIGVDPIGKEEGEADALLSDQPGETAAPEQYGPGEAETLAPDNAPQMPAPEAAAPGQEGGGTQPAIPDEPVTVSPQVGIGIEP